jgi:hypothetical protein
MGVTEDDELGDAEEEVVGTPSPDVLTLEDISRKRMILTWTRGT